MDLREIARLSKEAEKLRSLTKGIDFQQINELHHNSAVSEFSKVIAEINARPFEELKAKVFGNGFTQTLAEAHQAMLTNAGKSFLASALFDANKEANISALKLLEGFSTKTLPSEYIREVAGLARAEQWANLAQIGAAQMPIDKVLASHLSEMTYTSALAQGVLAHLDTSAIGNALAVAEQAKIDFRGQFTDFSSSYQSLFASFEVPQTSIFTLPPSVAEFPSIEFFNGVDLLETTVEEKSHNEDEAEFAEVREEIRENTNDSVILQLKAVNPHWMAMLEGARQALRSNNPDKTRHCITSLRELLREVMHYLSPDGEIKKWSNSADDFANNRPTRKARLKFITHKVNHDAFGKFVEKDIEAILAAINIFQAGTHLAHSNLTEAQIAALIARVEGTILFLFTIANSDE